MKYHVICRPRGPLSWLDPGAFGTLGVGGGFALGAKLVRPDAEVWVIYGDGSLGYSVAEFDTFTRHKVMLCMCGGGVGGEGNFKKGNHSKLDRLEWLSLTHPNFQLL